MSNQALDTQGTKLYIGDTGSPESFQLITERVRIGGPNESRPRRDVTDLDSTRREYKGGLRDSGEMELGLFYIPANAVHAILRNAFNETDATLRVKRFRLEFTDDAGTYWDFDGEVIGWQSTFEVDSDVNVTITISITGDITEGS
jgi:hypothetical protein